MTLFLVALPLMGVTPLAAEEEPTTPDPDVESVDAALPDVTADREPAASTDSSSPATAPDESEPATQRVDSASMPETESETPRMSDSSRRCHSRRCTATHRPTGTFFVQGGLAVFDMDSLNSRLSSNAYSELSDRTIPLGFGLSMRSNRIRTGIDWNWLWNHRSESADDDLQLSVRRRYWLVRYGVDVVQWRGLSVYPLVGIGAAFMRIDITQQSGAAFGDVLDSPARDSRLSQTSLLLDTSLGIDYRFVRRETDRKKSWVTVGLRGGYLFQPYAGDWRSTFAEIHDGPKRSFQGPVVQLLIGFNSEKRPFIAEP